MSGTAGAAPPTAVLGLGLDVRGPWRQRAAQKSRALVQTYLLTSSVQPPPTAGRGRGTKTPLRLPSLVATANGPRRRGSAARLSLSEPSLLTPNDSVLLFEGFSSKQPPPPPPFSKPSVLLPCKTCHPAGTSRPRHQQNHQHVQSCSGPAFIHFSQAIQPSAKPRRVRRHSHNPVLTAEMAQGDRRPLVMQCRNPSSQGEPLSVVGRPCLPSCTERPALGAAAGPARTQLHVFLPTEAEGDEVDSESVDEGFMDELDSKITSLKLQQGAPKTLTTSTTMML